jgi:predicted GNAT family acetyltransferase
VIGFTDYHERGDVMVFPHTVVDPAWRGQGMGDRLLRGAMGDMKTKGLRVDPQCWFVAEFLDRHEDLADVRADV